MLESVHMGSFTQRILTMTQFYQKHKRELDAYFANPGYDTPTSTLRIQHSDLWISEAHSTLNFEGLMR